ncbi:hypothetical protein [Anabaena sp. CCY 9910]|uniref:hypothetical protein n=1 Tax=Anabaena sp. CCY 9910 TaxID=3103870 RepID=UPI0039E19484
MLSNDLTVQLDISYEQTRTLVIEELKTSISGQISSLYSNIANLAVRKGIAENPSRENHLNPRYELSRKYKIWVEDIIWDLITEGIVRPGLGDGLNQGLPWYHISEYGKTVLISQPPQPYDPDGYLAAIRTIPNIDDVILAYLEESLKAFRIHCLLSSVITLGCASEKAILLLIEACKAAISNPTEQTDFEKKTDTIAIKRKHDEFQNILKTKIMPSLPKDLKENLDNYLIGLFSIIRSTRNDAGHPTGKEIRREPLYAYLVTFPEYLKKVYELINWLSTNKI